MANWCNNSVTFNGPEENIRALESYLREMEKRCSEQKCGVLPIIQNEPEDGYYFDIYHMDEAEFVGENSTVSINYSSKWSPNEKNVYWLACKLKVSFNLHYEESGNKIYGEYRMVYTEPEEETEKPIYEHRYLTDDEWDSCSYITDPDEKVSHDFGSIDKEEWERLLDEEDWSLMEDWEKFDDTLTDKEWENVN
jgi:hypothetical protein